MKQDSKPKIDRRDLLRALGVGAGAAAAPVALVTQAHAEEKSDDKRKARYNGNSEDVKSFYRVNHYPK